MKTDDIISRIDLVLENCSTPRSVRGVLEKVKRDIQKDNDPDITITSAIYELETVANNVNLQMHVKTMIWDIISALEAQKARK
ncbi:MAG: hypothetical protein MSIBF_07095 [Candidatus Altiarchaeales archaeon IMC4]|nr:MAG: hypothetical protein MSIBF_07095 [Candidatus Altiarchaeales archaeon IMC4]